MRMRLRGLLLLQTAMNRQANRLPSCLYGTSSKSGAVRTTSTKTTQESKDDFMQAVRSAFEQHVAEFEMSDLRREIVDIHRVLYDLKDKSTENHVWFSAGFGLTYTVTPAELLSSLKTQLEASFKHVSTRILQDMNRPSVVDQAGQMEIARGLQDLRRRVDELIFANS